MAIQLSWHIFDALFKFRLFPALKHILSHVDIRYSIFAYIWSKGMSQMIFYMNLLFIVIAVSLDGFGVGITYGMRKIRIPFRALTVIMLCSGMIVMISMMIGQLLRAFISPATANMIGSTILIFLGMFVLFSIVRPGQRNNHGDRVGEVRERGESHFGERDDGEISWSGEMGKHEDADRNGNGDGGFGLNSEIEELENAERGGNSFGEIGVNLDGKIDGNGSNEMDRIGDGVISKRRGAEMGRNGYSEMGMIRNERGYAYLGGNSDGKISEHGNSERCTQNNSDSETDGFIKGRFRRHNESERDTYRYSKMSEFKSLNQLQHFKSVLRDPFQADKDKSGTISISEAFVLGAALALDAFGAGLGAAMLGYSPFFTAILIAAMSGLFVFSGIKIGFLLAKNRLIARLTFMPPVLLICIGFFNLF